MSWLKIKINKLSGLLDQVGPGPYRWPTKRKGNALLGTKIL